MSEIKGLYISLGWQLTLLLVAFSYFVYDKSIGAMLAILIIDILCGIAIFLGFVPIAGPFLYWIATTKFIIPKILTMAAIETSWVVSVIFWVGLAFSVVVTVLATFVVIAIIWD